jgi:hypothetical protein
MKKTISVFLIGILFLSLGGGILYFFEVYVKDHVDTQEVLMAKDNISFKQLITEDDLVVRNVKKDNIVGDVYSPSDVNLVLNKYAAIDINKGTQIYPSLIDSYDLIPNESKGEFIAPIPDGWLFAVPGSLRKTFVADFYVIPDEEQAMLQALIDDEQEHSHKSEDGEEKNKDNEKPIENNETLDQAIVSKNEPILKDVRVSSVKDKSNREVTESKEETTATGVVSNLEIIADKEMLDKITEYTQKGNKIYVVYKYERSNEEVKGSESEKE